MVAHSDEGWSVESQYLNEVFKGSIWYRREAAIENLDGMQTGRVVLEGIGKILGFVVLSGDLAVTRKKTMKVAIEFSKNGVILSWRFSSEALNSS